jgi:hypothetical protein
MYISINYSIRKGYVYKALLKAVETSTNFLAHKSYYRIAIY